MQKFTHYILFIIIISLLSACSKKSNVMTKLDEADSVIEENCDSAYSILKGISNDINDMPENAKMKYYLILANAQNKLIIPMVSDSVFHEVVDYYDHKGNANEQLKAHYLLGCIYRDMKEAPVALQCYYDAVEKADTLDKNCDYLTLMSVWGQIAVLQDIQSMPKEELKAWEMYSKYAEKIGNTYEYIRGFDLSTMAYALLGDTAKIIDMTHQLFKMYKDYGFEEEAYSVYPPLYDILLSQGKYDEANKYIIDYETKSGKIKDGEVTEPARELYYQSKGNYYYGVNKLDSAEIFFRKLLRHKEYKYNAYRGLFKVYAGKQITDSILKFTDLQEKAWDEVIAENRIQAMHQVASMYDYSRYQRIAEEKRNEAKFNALLLIFAIFVFIVIVTIILIIYRRYKATKTAEIETLNSNYEKTKTEYVQAVDSLAEQKDVFEQFKKEKESEVEELKSKYDNLKSKDDEVALQNTDFMISVRNIMSPTSTKKFLSNTDLDELLTLVRQYLPRFFCEITNEDKLSQQELFVCILLRLNFSGKEISVLLNTSSSGIANAKKRANEKLFGMSHANMLLTNLKNMGTDDV